MRAVLILLADEETIMKLKKHVVVPLSLAGSVAALFFFQIEIASFAMGWWPGRLSTRVIPVCAAEARTPAGSWRD